MAGGGLGRCLSDVLTMRLLVAILALTHGHAAYTCGNREGKCTQKSELAAEPSTRSSGTAGTITRSSGTAGTITPPPNLDTP